MTITDCLFIAFAPSSSALLMASGASAFERTWTEPVVSNGCADRRAPPPLWPLPPPPPTPPPPPVGEVVVCGRGGRRAVGTAGGSPPRAPRSEVPDAKTEKNRTEQNRTSKHGQQPHQEDTAEVDRTTFCVLANWKQLFTVVNIENKYRRCLV